MFAEIAFTSQVLVAALAEKTMGLSTNPTEPLPGNVWRERTESGQAAELIFKGKAPAYLKNTRALAFTVVRVYAR